jgi:phospholipase C
VSPATITAGQTATLSWQVTGGTTSSLSIDNGVCSPCALPQGTATVTPSATTTYTATAVAPDGTPIKQSATVTVATQAAGTIKHIFFMLQENRSFDMYLGQLGAYRSARLAQVGITDTQTVDGFDPNVTLLNHHTGTHTKPFHEATVCTENLTPAWDESHHDVALTGGDAAWTTTTSFTNSSFAMNNFLDTTGSVTQTFDPNGTRALGFYNQDDLPYYYDLATFFATSDSWHSPILANTFPNRFYLMAGTSFGHEYPDGDANHPKYAAKTIFRAMNDANVSWTYYYKDGIFLAQFQDFFDPTIKPKTVPVSDLLSRLGGTCSGNPCDPDKALPQVIFIDSASGGSGLDEHPDSDVQKGAAFVQSIISALMNSDAWNDSVFILSYDEGGGLYDHVPPFTVPLPDGIAPGNCPDPNNGSFGYCRVGTLGGTFDLTGFRVPVIVISPFAKPHFVSHTPRDYTAILAFIEKTFNVPALSARDAFWQDPSRDMSEFFDFSAPNLLQAPTGVQWTQFLPTQPTGTAVCDPTKEAGPTF